MNYNNILIIRLDKIGDTILTTPAIYTLYLNFPQSNFYALSSSYNFQVLKHTNLFKDIYLIDEKESLRQFYLNKYDLAVVFSPTFDSFLWAFKSRAKRKIGYIYKTRILVNIFTSFLLTDKLIVDIDQKDVKENQYIIHEVEQNLQLIKQFLKLQNIYNDLYLGNIVEEKKIYDIVIHLHKGLLDFSNFLKKFLNTYLRKYKIVITYGLDIPLDYINALKQDYKDLLVLGNLSFSEWVSIFNQSRLAVSYNTGSAHLAAALHLPTIMIMEDNFFYYHKYRWHPWKVNYLLINKKRDIDYLLKIEKFISKNLA